MCAATRCSARGDVQYAAAPRQHVALDAQVSKQSHLWYARACGLSLCSTSALHRLRRLLRGAGRDMTEAIPGRSRETCASVRDRSHPHAGHHISAAACAGRGEAGAHRLRAVSLRLGSLVLRQPVSRLCDIAFLRASSCGVCARSWRGRLAAARALGRGRARSARIPLR